MTHDYYKNDTETLIYETIEQDDRDRSVTELADQLSLNRDTVSKYVEVLRQSGKIKVTRTVGNTVFYEEVNHEK